MPSRRTRSGCLTCRERRVKCDEGLPSCERCLKAGRSCRQGLPVKFVHGVRLARETVEADWSGTADYSFGANQQWLDLRAQHIRFVDETPEIAHQYVGVQNSYATVNDSSSPVGPQRIGPAETQQQGPELYGAARSERSYSNVSRARDPIQPRCADPQDACVFRYYLRKIAPYLDVCDQDRHFSVSLPELAFQSPLLFNAMLATAAHHMAHTSSLLDRTAAELYHARCVELLIPLLNEDSVISDEAIAAVVLLRFYEQMSSAVTGADAQRHLTGASAFLSSASSGLALQGVTQAAFWLYLRQDLDVALSKQQPLMLNLEEFPFSPHVAPPDNDWQWANSIVWLTAQAANYCFGRDRTQARHQEIAVDVEAWNQAKPTSFTPLCVEFGNDLDEIYFTKPWQALALQYFHTAKILLVLSNSSNVCFGIGSRESRQRLQSEVMEHALQLFGISSCGEDIQARLGASHVVSVVAPFIWDRGQQQLVVRMLCRLEREHAWPTREIAFGAMHEWQWTAEELAAWEAD